MASIPKTLKPRRVETWRRARLAKMYKSRRWLNASRAYRRQHPYCVQCLAEGVTNATDTCVDHINGHDGDWERFWDVDGNWQTLCRSHNALKAARPTQDGKM